MAGQHADPGGQVVLRPRQRAHRSHAGAAARHSRQGRRVADAGGFRNSENRRSLCQLHGRGQDRERGPAAAEGGAGRGGGPPQQARHGGPLRPFPTDRCLDSFRHRSDPGRARFHEIRAGSRPERPRHARSGLLPEGRRREAQGHPGEVPRAHREDAGPAGRYRSRSGSAADPRPGDSPRACAVDAGREPRSGQNLQQADAYPSGCALSAL